MDLSTVIITGANRGIGLALTKVFLQSGQWEILACCRDPANAHELKRLAKQSNEKIEIFPVDVTNEQSLAAFSSRIRDRKVDVLVNNAGIIGGSHQSAFDMDYDVWLETLKVNTLAPLRMVQATIDNLRLSLQPKIITISSQMGALNRKGRGSYAYSSSKAAVNKVMQILSSDLEQESIIVTMFHPGWVKTDMGGHAAEIPPEESASALFTAITNLKPSDSGRFYNWTGEVHPW